MFGRDCRNGYIFRFRIGRLWILVWLFLALCGVFSNWMFFRFDLSCIFRVWDYLIDWVWIFMSFWLVLILMISWFWLIKCEDDVNLWLVLVRGEWDEYFFPFSLMSDFLNCEGFSLFDLFLYLKDWWILKLIFEIIDMWANFQVNKICVVSTFIEHVI